MIGVELGPFNAYLGRCDIEFIYRNRAASETSTSSTGQSSSVTQNAWSYASAEPIAAAARGDYSRLRVAGSPARRRSLGLAGSESFRPEVHSARRSSHPSRWPRMSAAGSRVNGSLVELGREFVANWRLPLRCMGSP